MAKQADELVGGRITSIKKTANDANNAYKLYKYYFIIAIVSLIAVFFLPMLGATTAAGFVFPTTAVGWVIYIVTKLCVAGINMMLFHCFMCQGKLNIKDNPYYLEACEILRRYGIMENNRDPRGPDEWLTGEYRTKGISITITTVLSAIAITQAILVFDWISMLTYLFTIIMGIVFGLLQQDTAETYWTTEFWHYAKNIEKEHLEKENQNDNTEQHSVSQS